MNEYSILASYPCYIFFVSPSHRQATAKPPPRHANRACQGMPRHAKAKPRHANRACQGKAKAPPRHANRACQGKAKAKPRHANRAGQQSMPTEHANRACQGKAKAKARHMPHSKKAGTLLIVLEYLLKFPFIQACRYKWLQEPHQQQQSETSSQGTAHWP